jgi:hypothetical protein
MSFAVVRAVRLVLAGLLGTSDFLVAWLSFAYAAYVCLRFSDVWYPAWQARRRGR